MRRDKENKLDKEEKVNNENIEITNETTSSVNTDATAEIKDNETAGYKELLAKKEAELKEHIDRTQRLAAEYDNFRKRTQKEKDKLYGATLCEVVAKFLEIYDSLERALKASESEQNSGLREGVVLVSKQYSDVLSKMGVKPIEAEGTTFNPEYHNAVMHIEDENLDHNVVVEEFLKGFIYNDEIVIRHSVVKVAN